MEIVLGRAGGPGDGTVTEGELGEGLGGEVYCMGLANGILATLRHLRA